MIQAHSGYVLPLPLTAWSLPWGELGGELGRHAFHHSHPNANANFGGYFNWWDRLMGTDKPYLAWVEEKRRERERGGLGVIWNNNQSTHDSSRVLRPVL